MSSLSSTAADRPLALTMGCPAGIGPEIVCRLLFVDHPECAGQAVVIGDLTALRQAAAVLGIKADFRPWQPGERLSASCVSVFQVDPPLSEVSWGRPDAACARVMTRAIEEAVRLVGEGWCSGLVTCPITKTGLRLAGYAYPGHTEMLAALTGASKVRMMMAGERLKVVLVTIHEPLGQVSGRLSIEEIVDCIEMTRSALVRDFALDSPRIAVAGFNPHGGESGLFGDEEMRLIGPAVARCASGAGEISGPFSPDTVFYQAAAGRYDAVIAMYHDQGLIPFKLLHFHDGVNVTLGLPLVRTSVDHGTAYDIAGRNLADTGSLAAAVRLARTIIANRARMEAA